MNTHVPFVVRAHLVSGLAHAGPWGIALDGLLAAQVHARAKAAARDAGELPVVRALAYDDPPDLLLPLSRCEPVSDLALWHWAATCSHPDEGFPRPDVHTWIGQVDHRHLEQVAGPLPRVVSRSRGRYRSRRMPLLVTPCRSVTWQGVGDPEAIEELLAGVSAIGKRRSSGEGQVLRWEVLPAPEMDLFAAAHLHADGSLGRSTPAACLSGRPEVTDAGVGTAGLRPPYVHVSRQRRLHLPVLSA